MKYIEAPNNYVLDGPSLFLAGGITNCRNWQTELVWKLLDTNLTILNPRRENWNGLDESAIEEQIKWEYNALLEASMISFWFSSETVQPITLFELGKWCVSNKPIFVGIDPNYSRKQDLEIQIPLVRDIEIVYDLNDLAQQIKDSYV